MTNIADNGVHLIQAYLQFLRSIGFDEVLIPAEVRKQTEVQSLETIRMELGACTRCPLHGGRKSVVFGEGDPHARLMFVGEGPGADEDREGRPFVGKAGQLLTRMIEAMGLTRSEVYITNVVKCRPPQNRDPEAAEMRVCLPFLEAQISAVQPEVIVALGRIAAGALLGTRDPLTKMRGTFHPRNRVSVIPTYHPSFLLRKEGDKHYKAEAWADLKQVMALLGLPVPASGGAR